MRSVLIVSASAPDPDLTEVLARHNWSPLWAADPDGARALATDPALLVGLALIPAEVAPNWLAACARLIQASPDLRWVAVMSRRQSGLPVLRRLIVEALYDFQVEPVESQRLCHALGHAYGIAAIERELARPGVQGDTRYNMIGVSPAMQGLYDAIERVAPTDSLVLVIGRTGTGKELVARAVHERSTRATGPMVSVNCAAIPATLIQSELFGHAQGSFTGATRTSRGLIETAAGGTLFLDEVGEMPLESQASLLRFLDHYDVRAVGAEESRPVDVRVIAATNRHLDEQVAVGAFRADLFYRLSVLTLHTPSLQERGEDVDALARHFLAKARERFKVVPIGFTVAALAALRRHPWPGNVRELRSRVFQGAIACTRRYLGPADLGLADAVSPAPTRPLAEVREQAEVTAIIAALGQAGENVSAAAKALGVSRMTLYRLMEKHDIPLTTRG